MTDFPAEAWRQSAAPAWVDPTGGDASWVVAEADVKVLHWMCAVRDLDAGGKMRRWCSGYATGTRR